MNQRIRDQNKNWRIVYVTHPDAILILEVFNQQTRTTPADVVANCWRRLNKYEADAGGRRRMKK